MMHYEILSEEFFGKFYDDTFFDCPHSIYTSVLEDDRSSEYSLIQTMWILDQRKDKNS